MDTHSWSTVKVDCWGLKFFWQFVLKKQWQWVNIVKPPKVKSLPDILAPSEIEQLIGKTRKLRYRIFLLTTYSMGLRLSETLSLQVGDIDGKRKQVHIRRGKSHKDRFVPLPDLTLHGLRELWSKHRHPKLLFPNANGPIHRVKYAKNHMDRGGAQKAMKVVVHECGIKKCLHPFPAPQLCHSPSGTWPESASYPGPSNPCQPEHHRTVHPAHPVCRKR